MGEPWGANNMQISNFEETSAINETHLILVPDYFLLTPQELFHQTAGLSYMKNQQARQW